MRKDSVECNADLLYGLLVRPSLKVLWFIVTSTMVAFRLEHGVKGRGTSGELQEELETARSRQRVIVACLHSSCILTPF